MDKLNNRPQGVRILIVEDDVVLSTALAENLKAEKFEVVIVDNGLDVFDEVVKFKPDIILLDLVIPDQEGLTILKQLKENPETANIPIITISEVEKIDNLKAAQDLGAYQCFLKDGAEVGGIVNCVKEKINK
jgi:DNA-binding response OmpR family regulator